MVDPDKMKQEEQKLSDTLFQNPNSRCYENCEKANKEAKRYLYCPGSKLLEDKEHIIPPPSVLLWHWKRAVDIWANVRDAKMGEMLFSKKTWKVHYATCTHIEKGCYSDKPGFNYYYFMTSKTGKLQLMCIRGTSESFQEPMSQPAPLQRSTMVPQGEGETVALPPIEVNAASQNELVMQTVHKGCHLTAPVQQLALHPAVEPVQRHQIRCLRCGLSKTGQMHASKAAKNSLDYCRVHVDERFTGWIVPAGYKLGDTRPAKGQKTIQREWKRHREQEQFDEHPDFQDW